MDSVESSTDIPNASFPLTAGQDQNSVLADP